MQQLAIEKTKVHFSRAPVLRLLSDLHGITRKNQICDTVKVRAAGSDHSASEMYLEPFSSAC